jgi:hypothetical protein
VGADLGLSLLCPHATVIGAESLDEDGFVSGLDAGCDLAVPSAVHGVDVEDRPICSLIAARTSSGTASNRVVTMVSRLS